MSKQMANSHCLESSKELELLEGLKNANLKEYNVNSFRRYWTSINSYTSKKSRVVKEMYITTYSLYKKRLLGRTFFFQERIKKKQIERHCVEVERTLAGLSKKLSRYVIASMYCGLRVRSNFWSYESSNETNPYSYIYQAKQWKICPLQSYQLWELVNNWTGQTVITHRFLNNPGNLIKKSVHKYCAYDYLPDDRKIHNYLFEYLCKYEKRPKIEILEKLGLDHIVDDMRGIKWKAKGPAMLGITANELKYLQTGISLKQYQAIREETLKYNFSQDEFRVFAKLKERCIEIKKGRYGWTLKTIKYLTINSIQINDYVDQLRLLSDLEMPLSDEFYFPKDFYKSHDSLVERYAILQDEILTMQMEENRENAEKLLYEEKEYKIVPLLNQEELSLEGKKMHNCVAAYACRVADHKCLIYSLRLKSDNKSLVTIELNGNDVVQARTYHNGPVAQQPVLLSVMNRWEKKFKLKRKY